MGGSSELELLADMNTDRFAHGDDFPGKYRKTCNGVNAEQNDGVGVLIGRQQPMAVRG